jgi:hypothetical protein
MVMLDALRLSATKKKKKKKKTKKKKKKKKRIDLIGAGL